MIPKRGICYLFVLSANFDPHGGGEGHTKPFHGSNEELSVRMQLLAKRG